MWEGDGGGGGGGDDVYLNPSILRLKQIQYYHLCEMASVIETKDMLLQRLRERLAQEDLQLKDLRNHGEDALLAVAGSLGFNPVDRVKVVRVLRIMFASSDAAQLMPEAEPAQGRPAQGSPRCKFCLEPLGQPSVRKSVCKACHRKRLNTYSEKYLPLMKVGSFMNEHFFYSSSRTVLK